MPHQSATHARRFPADAAPVWVLFLFTLALCAQMVHMLEHVIQLYQHAIMNIDILHSHGLLFFFDTEWVHFFFNLAYFSSLLAICYGMGLRDKSTREDLGKAFVVAMIFVLCFEGWHLIEHAVRVYQQLQSGCQPCKGIFGQVVDVVYLHTFYNFVVTVTSTYIYIKFGFARRFWEII